jgi:hypothetical protein
MGRASGSLLGAGLGVGACMPLPSRGPWTLTPAWRAACRAGHAAQGRATRCSTLPSRVTCSRAHPARPEELRTVVCGRVEHTRGRCLWGHRGSFPARGWRPPSSGAASAAPGSCRAGQAPVAAW